MQKLLICCLICFTTTFSLVLATHRVVSTPQGSVLGRELNSRLDGSGTDFWAFQGIRYGVAQRFEESRPWTWNGTLNATREGPVCPQFLAPGYSEMSEDCLHLSVYVRKSTLDGNETRPVVVFVHGGAFLFGSSSMSVDAGPQYFMEHDVVLVTFNFRLNVFGFVSTGTKEAPGNLGLKDQVLALKWVQRNIASFNGGEVTLVGHSSGAMAVSLHLASPMSRGLFDRAVLMSGSAIAQWKVPRNLNSLVQKYSRIFNCSTEEPSEILQCLREVPMTTLAEGYEKLPEWRIYPILSWIPVVEEDYGQERFLLEDPYLTLQRSHETPPVLMGHTKDEWALATIQFLTDPRMFWEFNKDFDFLAPICFMYEQGTLESSVISARLRSHTFGNSPVSRSNVSKLSQLFSEALVTYGVYRTANLLSDRSSPVFLYRFSFVGQHSHVRYPSGRSFGAAHGDDQYYLWVSNQVPQFGPLDSEWSMVLNLTGIVAHFAEFGRPPFEEWTPYSTQSGTFMDLNEHFIVKTSVPRDRIRLWDSLFQVDLDHSYMKSNWILLLLAAFVFTYTVIFLLEFHIQRKKYKALDF